VRKTQDDFSGPGSPAPIDKRCEGVKIVPPRICAGDPPPKLTGDQQAIYDAQPKPENATSFIQKIDGCKRQPSIRAT